MSFHFKPKAAGVFILLAVFVVMLIFIAWKKPELPMKFFPTAQRVKLIVFAVFTTGKKIAASSTLVTTSCLTLASLVATALIFRKRIANRFARGSKKAA